MGKKIGISLSGGSARGIAHIGVIKALEENGIHPEIICGVSAGALIGAVYAAGHTPEEIHEFATAAKFKKIFGFEWFKLGLTTNIHIREILESYIEEDSFECLKTPLFIGASNLNTGVLTIFNSGPLFDVVRASCSVPIIFSPVKINNDLYVDGGVLNNMPTKAMRSTCDFVIGSNVVPFSSLQSKSIKSIPSVTSRIFELNLWSKVKDDVHNCEIIIEPEGIEKIGFFDFKKVDELVTIGYEATLKRIEQIKHKILESEESF